MTTGIAKAAPRLLANGLDVFPLTKLAGILPRHCPELHAKTLAFIRQQNKIRNIDSRGDLN
jgi:hypothetical protein